MRRPQRRVPRGGNAAAAAAVPPGMLPPSMSQGAHGEDDDGDAPLTEGEQLAQALWAAAHSGAEGGAAPLARPARPQRRRQVQAAPDGALVLHGSHPPPPPPPAATGPPPPLMPSGSFGMYPVAMAYPAPTAVGSNGMPLPPTGAGMLAPVVPMYAGAAPEGAAAAAEAPAPGEGASSSSPPTPQPGQHARSPTALVQVLTSHALRLGREMRALEAELDGNLARTKAMIANILRYR